MCCIYGFLLWTHISPVRDWFADLSWLEWSPCKALLQAAGGWGADALGCAHPCSVGSEGCPHTGRLSCYPAHQPDLPAQTRRWWRSWALGSTGTQPICCFLIHLVAISAGGEQVSETISPFKEQASKDKSPEKVQRKRNFIKTIIIEASLLLLKMYRF